jgi:hypothetical protein
MIENGSMSESKPPTRELKKLQLISYCPLATTSLGGVQFVQVNFDSLEVQDSKPICSRQTERLLLEKV